MNKLSHCLSEKEKTVLINKYKCIFNIVITGTDQAPIISSIYKLEFSLVFVMVNDFFLFYLLNLLG